jgi:LysR family transcriptional regulator, nitrogen assimilation regulatory protein
MDLKKIRYFLAVVDYGSLTKAAEHLRVAQPALSQQMRHLETDCQAKLLIRTKQGVKVTEVGKIFYRHARTLLRQLEQAREEIRNGVSTASGPVVVGLPATVAIPLGVPLVKAVQEQYPGVRLHVFESLSSYLYELLVNNRLDFAVLFRDFGASSISLSRLAREKLYLIGDCGLSERSRQRETCSFAELQSVPLVLPSKDDDVRCMVEQAFTQAGLEANIIADIDSLSTTISLLAEGVGCTILPLSALSTLGSSSKLRARRIVSPEIVQTVSLCWLENVPLSPAAEAVKELIRSVIARLVSDGRWPVATLEMNQGHDQLRHAGKMLPSTHRRGSSADQGEAAAVGELRLRV